MLRPDVLILQSSVLDSSIASDINVGKKTWCDWPEKVFSLYLGNIKQDGGIDGKKKALKMNQNTSSLMLAGAQKWKKVQMSEKTWIK